jgi:hypothetical protein
VRALECLRRLGLCLTEAAPDIIQAGEFERLHPAPKLVAHRPEIRRAVPQDRGDHLHDVGAREDRFDSVIGRRHAAGDGEGTANAAAENREPPKAQEQFTAVGQVQMRPHCQRPNVDIRLHETVEQDQTVGARPIELASDIAKCREERREFDGDRDVQLALEIPRNLTKSMFDGEGRLVGVGDHLVHVQLECVGAGLLDQFGKSQPRFGGRPVQGRDHRNLDGALDLAHVLEILVRTERVLLRFGEIREDGRKLAIERVQMMNPPGRRLGDLLLEQRVKDNGGAPRVLEPPDGVQVIGERRGAGHEWIRQCETEIRCREINRWHRVRPLASRLRRRRADRDDDVDSSGEESDRRHAAACSVHSRIRRDRLTASTSWRRFLPGGLDPRAQTTGAKEPDGAPIHVSDAVARAMNHGRTDAGHAPRHCTRSAMSAAVVWRRFR